LKASVEGGKAFVNKVGIAATDIEAANGVIHVVEQVLLP
jgi:uncharacterized surface protein with fasciclin (FAS1) repeats